MRLLIALLVVGCGGTRPDRIRNLAPNSTDIFVAVLRDPAGLAIAKVDRASVRIVLEAKGVDTFAWLDSRGLVAARTEDEGLTIDRYLDAAVVESVRLGHDEWPKGNSAAFAITPDGETWISRCVAFTDGMACTEVTFLRVIPSPRITSNKRPLGIDPEAGLHPSPILETWPRPQTVDAPAGIALATVPVDYKFERGSGVECRKGSERVVHPRVEDVIGFKMRTVRWVRTYPPIYEVHGDTIEAGRYTAATSYHRPCDPAPLDGYASLDESMWAEFRDKPGAVGTWTFYAGDTPLGTLDGRGGLRVNRPR